MSAAPSTEDHDTEVLLASAAKVVSMINALGTDQDGRSLAIVTMAMIEECLKGLLIAFMIDRPPVTVKGMSASMLQSWAVSLGLISERDRDLISAMGEIRNVFAHQWEVASFYDDRLIDKMREFRSAAKHPDAEDSDLFQPDRVSAANLFRYLATGLIQTLVFRRIAVGKARAGLAAQWPPSSLDTRNGFMMMVVGHPAAAPEDLAEPILAVTPAPQPPSAPNS